MWICSYHSVQRRPPNSSSVCLKTAMHLPLRIMATHRRGHRHHGYSLGLLRQLYTQGSILEVTVCERNRRRICYPEGCAAPGRVPCQCNTRGPLSKLKRKPPLLKITVTSKTPVGVISVVTLIRTDTTLDHSQKAEKV